MKIIPENDTDINAAISALEAAWAAGASSVTVERPAVIEVIFTVGESVRAVDCNECPAVLCTAECRRLNHIARLQEEYTAAEQVLAEAGRKLREAVTHG